MIYAIGLDSDNTFASFVKRACAAGSPLEVINIRRAVAGEWRLAIPSDGDAYVRLGKKKVVLDPQGSYYCRLIDLSPVFKTTEEAQRWRFFITSLGSWLCHIPGLVINRPGSPSDNACKPLHEHLLRAEGFRVPESITSSDGARLRQFSEEGPTVAKAISGVRATCRMVNPDDFTDFLPQRGPVHLQRYVAGSDVRAHVLGEQVFAEEIRSDGVDYRQAKARNTFAPIELSGPVCARLIEVGRRLGLMIAGWDFKLAESGDLWCLEVNPMPGYDSYDRRAGGQITRALLNVLSRGSDGG